ncbi:MAG: zinc-binding alcohol dehydrogenase family protein [Sphingomonas sp.]|jgi:2-desacetyl-2-hydroxyethyl bacteriochlorophyllide A dehydrogenase|uniref:zinc-binding alcohol dehydrogenase family protein n=1 Tax=Sphingomonas sp. TaxID=28214 RepID=UPI003568051B
MRSLVCLEPGSLLLEERPKPTRAEDEALIRIRRVGICGTDMHIFHGRQPYLSYPRVMGHEFAGDVEAAPEGSGLTAGDRVLVMPYLSCGTCSACRQGKTNCCSKLEVLGVHRDGALADYVSVPVQFILKADGLSLDQAAMVEFLSIGAHAVGRAAIRPGQRALIVGAGPIGLAASLFSVLAGGRVTVVDTREDRLAFAARELQVDHVVPLSDDTEASLRRITNGDFFDVVFDATGSPRAMETGFAYVAHGGTYVLISVVSSAITFSDPEFHKRETTLLASRNATIADFETVMRAMREGKVPTDAFGSHRATLDEFPRALLDWIDPESHVIKALIEV